MKKRGISPVIATVLLIAMVVVVALIIFIWFRGMVGESATKFGKNIELNCEDVEFDASFSSSTDTLSIVNRGNVPIFRVRIKIFEKGSHTTKELDSDDGWVDTGLGQGGTFSGSLDLAGLNPNKITVFPVLIGEGKDGRKTYICEGQYGEDIIL